MGKVVKGIWIPIEVWEDPNLSWNEKILLMEIDSFTKAGRDCYFSNEYISALLSVSNSTARRMLRNLIEKEYVVVVRFDGRHRYIASNIIPRLAKKCQAEWSKMSGQGGQKRTGRVFKNEQADCPKKTTYNNKVNNIYNNTEDNNRYTPSASSASSSPAFNFKKSLLDLGVTDETAEAWLMVRRRLKAVNTQLAFTHIENEIRKSGKTAEECIRTAAEKSWRGFEAEWIKKTSPQPPSYQQPEKLNNYEKGLIVYDEKFGTHLYQDYLDGKKNRTYNGIDEQ